MITADTITDEQIRELRESEVGDQRRVCQTALGEPFWWGEVPDSWSRRVARARCAEILNARDGGASR